MKLYPTMANSGGVEFSYALLNPSSFNGGLYAPIDLPQIDEKFLQEATKLSYSQLALKIVEKFGFDVDLSVFSKALKRYEKFDNPNEPVVMKKLGENLYINELYHGPTRAFKDMALQPFGEILSSLAVARNEKFLIMCATSGDTGPATLETFADMPNVRVVCLYPKDGTSEVQRLQMINADAKNLKVIGINGNFDDAQNALKTLLANENFKSELKKLGVSFSAANSVNFGRILFQIIYHIYAYVWLLKNGEIERDESFDIVVPSGNFGNALGAYYAKKMGIKINKIKIVSNKNNILTEFFTTGKYDLNGKTLQKTISPAMDILISSNVERLIFDKFGWERTKELINALRKDKKYELTRGELAMLNADFQADFCDDEQCEKYIKFYADKRVSVDPHTATCFKMTDNLLCPTVVTSTAHWVKFAPSMAKALEIDNLTDEMHNLKELAKIFNEQLPQSILQLFSKKTVHTDVAEKDEIEKKILQWIKK